MLEKPVTIEVRKAGQHWAVFAEEQLITQTVYEKGAQTLEAPSSEPATVPVAPAPTK